MVLEETPLSLRFNTLWFVARIPLRSRNDPRSPEKSLLAAQPYFFDHSSNYAILVKSKIKGVRHK